MTTKCPDYLRLSPIFLLAFFCFSLSACQSALTTATPVVTPAPTNAAIQATGTLLNETLAPPPQMGLWPISPDGQWMAAKSDNGAWWMWDATSKQPLYMLSDVPSRMGRYMHLPTFSPDNRFLAVISMGRVLLWEIATRKRRILMLSIAADYHSMRRLIFSSDSQFIAVNGCQKADKNALCSNGFVNVWSTHDGNLFHTVGAGFPVESISFSSDATSFSIAGCSRTDVSSGYCYEQSQAIYNIEDGELITLKRIPQF